MFQKITQRYASVCENSQAASLFQERLKGVVNVRFRFHEVYELLEVHLQGEVKHLADKGIVFDKMTHDDLVRAHHGQSESGRIFPVDLRYAEFFEDEIIISLNSLCAVEKDSVAVVDYNFSHSEVVIHFSAQGKLFLKFKVYASITLITIGG